MSDRIERQSSSQFRGMITHFVCHITVGNFMNGDGEKEWNNHNNDLIQIEIIEHILSQKRVHHCGF